jgi:hypothetical protein
MPDVKEKLHRLVDACSNEALLEEIKTVLENAESTDWWVELPAFDQNLLLESEAQYKRGEFICHAELLKRYEEWKILLN